MQLVLHSVLFPDPYLVIIGLLHHPVNDIYKSVSVDAFLLLLDAPIPVEGPDDEQVPSFVIQDLNSTCVLVSLDEEGKPVLYCTSVVEAAPGC